MNCWKILMLAGALVLAGCAGQSGTGMDDGAAGGAGSGAGADGGPLSWPDDEGADGGSAIALGDDRENVVMNNRVVYFAFDSSELDDAAIEILQEHGRYLAENPGEVVRLEGHTDERGSREYNIGLGQRRAVSVKSMLLVYGASERQLQPVSFGEERPADPGTGEEAWAQNRRVEIVYLR